MEKSQITTGLKKIQESYSKIILATKSEVMKSEFTEDLLVIEHAIAFIDNAEVDHGKS